MTIDKELLDKLIEKAKASERLRMNMDMRTSNEDDSQMMLNAMMPGTEVAVHRHPNSVENVLLLTGRMEEIFYEEAPLYLPLKEGETDPRMMDAQDVARNVTLREVERIHLCPAEGKFGCQVPKGMWHTVEVFEPSVIFEGKDGGYGKDGSETFK